MGDVVKSVDDLVHLLKLERLEVNLFRGESRDIGSKQVFGGQVLGQALAAASYTVDDLDVHSLHAYFLRRGDMEAPIVYEVDRQRDGRSFSNRRVVAIQHGRPILNMAASFQKLETGLEHQDPMPDVPRPEELDGRDKPPEHELEKLPQKARRFLFANKPFEFRWVQTPDYIHPQTEPPQRQLWFRLAKHVGDDPITHRSILAYVSDYGLLTTSLLPHALSLFNERLQLASLDHAMWFHRDFRADDWMLYDFHSPNAVGARGLVRGRIFDKGGKLVASTMQEGLIRVWDEPESE